MFFFLVHMRINSLDAVRILFDVMIEFVCFHFNPNCFSLNPMTFYNTIFVSGG